MSRPYIAEITGGVRGLSVGDRVSPRAGATGTGPTGRATGTGHVDVESSNFILFYGKDSPFSQHHLATIKLDGFTYNCSEQMYMQNKAVYFGDVETGNCIMNSPNPKQQKKLGRTVKGFNRNRWMVVAPPLVRQCSMAKFEQNPVLRDILLQSFPKILVEANPFDSRWGIGLSASDERSLSRKTWRGENLLGFILTSVRDTMLQEMCGFKTLISYLPVSDSVVGKTSTEELTKVEKK
jgi:ribA/ribD-fused uncharacterized protein